MKQSILTLIFIGAFCTSSYAQTYHYRMYQKKTGETLEVSQATFEPVNQDQIKLTFEKGVSSYTQKEEYFFNRAYETLHWHIVIPDESTDYTGKRLGNAIHLEGRFKGKAVDKDIKIDEDPFFAFPKFELQPRPLSERAGAFTFWAMRQDTLDIYKMTASFRGEETVKLNGKDVKAWKIFWSPANGLLQVFKRTYYFRQPDGIYLMQEYPDGRVRALIMDE